MLLFTSRSAGLRAWVTRKLNLYGTEVLSLSWSSQARAQLHVNKHGGARLTSLRGESFHAESAQRGIDQHCTACMHTAHCHCIDSIIFKLNSLHCMCMHANNWFHRLCKAKPREFVAQLVSATNLNWNFNKFSKAASQTNNRLDPKVFNFQDKDRDRTS